MTTEPRLTREEGFEALLGRVLPHATREARSSGLHGPEHWRRVSEVGAQLCAHTPGADPHVVSLFAALHDAQRLSDGHDPDHGKRAAALAQELRRELFEATDEQLDTLWMACFLHADGLVAACPTVGVCWDADRLDLPRCGMRPDPRLLSTGAAKALLTRKGG